MTDRAPEPEYRDLEGNPVSLDTLCRKEPAWAANRIRVTLNERDALRAEVEQLRRSRDGWEHDAGLYARNAADREAEVERLRANQELLNGARDRQDERADSAEAEVGRLRTQLDECDSAWWSKQVEQLRQERDEARIVAIEYYDGMVCPEPDDRIEQWRKELEQTT